MTSELKVDKITPASGTNTQIGEAGDTTNLSAGTVTLPTSIITGATEKTTLVDADKFLISDSADSNAFKHVQKSNLPSGTLVEVDQASIAAGSSVAAVNFSNIFSSTYNTYFVRMSKIRFAGNTPLNLRFFSDTGTSEISLSYYYFAFYGLDMSNNEERDFGNGDNKLVLTASLDYDQPADGGATGFFYIDNPLANNSLSVNVTGQFGYRNDSNVFNATSFAGKFSGSSARYGFKLYGTSNVELADITVYGVKP